MRRGHVFEEERLLFEAEITDLKCPQATGNQMAPVFGDIRLPQGVALKLWGVYTLTETAPVVTQARSFKVMVTKMSEDFASFSGTVIQL
jgi:hypothetical protein